LDKSVSEKKRRRAYSGFIRRKDGQIIHFYEASARRASAQPLSVAALRDAASTAATTQSSIEMDDLTVL